MQPKPGIALSFSDLFWTSVGIQDGLPIYGSGGANSIIRQFVTAIGRFEARGRRNSLIMLLRQAELAGDLSYASPEHIRDDEIDERSLVFSLSVVLYERLSGAHPFGSTEQRYMRSDRVRRGHLGSGMILASGNVGPRAILVRGMSPYADERWETIAELGQRLNDFLAATDQEEETTIQGDCYPMYIHEQPTREIRVLVPE